jgi:hypothetical protein
MIVILGDVELLPGNKPAGLILGHGIVIVDSLVRTLVSRAYSLRVDADIQEQGMFLDGKVQYLSQPQGAPITPSAAVALENAALAIDLIFLGAGSDTKWSELAGLHVALFRRNFRSCKSSQTTIGVQDVTAANAEPDFVTSFVTTMPKCADYWSLLKWETA